jgi:hypothetical protein
LDRSGQLPSPTRTQATPTSFADEAGATLARLFAYVGTLALFGMLVIRLWDQMPTIEADAPSVKAGWSAAARIPRLPSGGWIRQTKHRLMRSSGVPEAAARTFCAPRSSAAVAGAAASSESTDWVTGAENPPLRGTL